jgi:hypothetical protein
MGVSTEIHIKFYTEDKKFVNKYNLDDRSDDYVYEGLVSGGGSEFKPENFGEFSDEQKKIMKIYFDEESESVSEGYAKATKNIQSPEKLLPIWTEIRSSIIAPFQQNLISYHNEIINDYKNINDKIENYNSQTNIVTSKNKMSLPKLTKLKSENDFKRTLRDTIWKIDSISKVIALLIVARDNKMLVEITVVDG